MYTISKTFEFSASHVLNQMPIGHPCNRLHGHNYKVTVWLRSKRLNAEGMVLDYHALRPFKEYLDAALDHQHLNDRLLDPPTAENIAHALYLIAKHLASEVYAVGVAETDATYAEYSEDRT